MRSEVCHGVSHPIGAQLRGTRGIAAPSRARVTYGCRPMTRACALEGDGKTVRS